MTDWQAVWKRLSDGKHVVLCGVGPIPDPEPARVCLAWVDCAAHPEPGGTIEAARRRIDRDLDINPWVDIAAQRMRSSLRRHLLGEDADDIDTARDEHTFRRAMRPSSFRLMLAGSNAPRRFGQCSSRGSGVPYPWRSWRNSAARGVAWRHVVGDVQGRVAILLDDLISSGRTLAIAARACRERGAEAVHAAATHGVFSPDAAAVLQSSELQRIVVLDTVPRARDLEKALSPRLQVMPCAPLLADAIRALHEDGSLVALQA